MAVVTPTAKAQFIDAAGVPLAGGFLYTYEAGTTTPQATYTDSTAATANSNPIVLDSRGEANIWLASANYKFKLTDANGTEIWTVDNIAAPSTALSPVFTSNVTISTDSPGPALLITQSGAGPIIRAVNPADPAEVFFTVTSDGSVGIGTGSPSNAIDVAGGAIQISTAGGTARTVMSADDTDSIFEASSTRNFTVKTNSATRLTINATNATSTVPVVLPGAPTSALQAATKAYVDTSTPPGALLAYAASTAPTGWLLCDGSAVSRTTYADLYAAIGTTWGAGDTTTTFNVPDLRGQFLRGYDSRATSTSKDTTTLSGITTNTSTTISGIADTTYLYVGMPISGTGIPAGATIATKSTNSITISSAATATSSTLSAATTNASTTVLVSSTSTLSIGQAISGTNIPTGAYITAINSATSITISAAATGSTTTVNFTLSANSTTASAGTNTTLAANMGISGNGVSPGTIISSLTGGTGGTSFVMSKAANGDATGSPTALLFTTGTINVGTTITVGRTFASAQIDAYANHTHSVNDPGHKHVSSVQLQTIGTTSGLQYPSTTGAGYDTTIAATGISVNNSLTGNVETRPKNYAVLYIIKT
jgi:microcystin-dependent protein